jgi:hypothetical protein
VAVAVVDIQQVKLEEQVAQEAAEMAAEEFLQEVMALQILAEVLE